MVVGREDRGAKAPPVFEIISKKSCFFNFEG